MTDKTIEELQSELEQLRREEKPSLESLGEVLLQIGAITNDGGQHAEAIPYLEEAYTYLQQVGSDDIVSKCHNYLGRAYWYTNQFHNSILHFNKLREFAVKIGPRKLEAYALRCAAVGERCVSEYRASIEHLKSALAILNELGETEVELADVLQWLGVLHNDCADYEEALRYLLQALDIFTRLKDELSTAEIYNSLGLIFIHLNQLDRASEFLNHALELWKALNSEQGGADALNNLGMVASAQNDYPKALEYYQQSLEIQRRGPSRQRESNVLNNIGNVYRDMEELEKSLEYHEEALALRRQIDFKDGIVNSLMNISYCHIHQGRTVEARETLLGLIPEVERIGNRGRLMSIYEILCEIAEIEQDWQNGYQWLKQLHNEKDQILGEEKILKIANVLGDYLEAVKKRETEELQRRHNDLEKSYQDLKDAQQEIITLEKRNTILAMAVTANHEINQPLMVAKGNLEMLLKMDSEIPPDENRQRYLQRIGEGLDRITSILDKFRKITSFSEADYSTVTKMIIIDEPSENEPENE